MKSLSATLMLAVSGLMISTLYADTNNVKLPENYASTFVRYTSVDKPEGKRPAKMRFFYVHPDILAVAQPGKPLPDGTVLIMEDHKIQLDTAGKPVLDSNGRFIPTDEITNVFVQEKRTGWGENYPEDVRNGDWEYAWFLADGTRKENAKLDGCFGCHKGAAANDFTFSLQPFLAAIKQN